MSARCPVRRVRALSGRRLRALGDRRPAGAAEARAGSVGVLARLADDRLPDFDGPRTALAAEPRSGYQLAATAAAGHRRMRQLGSAGSHDVAPDVELRPGSQGRGRAWSRTFWWVQYSITPGPLRSRRRPSAIFAHQASENQAVARTDALRRRSVLCLPLAETEHFRARRKQRRIQAQRGVDATLAPAHG